MGGAWHEGDAGPARQAASYAEIWLGPSRMIPLDVMRLRGGLCTIEVVAPSPCHATLSVVFEAEDLAELQAPLECVAATWYRSTVSLVAPARRAWVTLTPALDDAPATVRVSAVSWRHMAALGWSAIRRHATNPGALVAKARQVMTRGSSLVLASHAGDETSASDNHRTWRTAFESDAQIARIEAVAKSRCGARPARVLAIVGRWPHGRMVLETAVRSLIANVAAEVHLLDLSGEADLALRDLPGLASFEQAHNADETIVGDRAVPAAVARTNADLVLILEQPGRFHATAIRCFQLGLALSPEAVAVYGDHDHLDATGTRFSPNFKPAWSPDYQLAADYIGPAVAVRADAPVLAAITRHLADGIGNFAILAELASQSDVQARVAHVPRLLFHADAAGHRSDADAAREAARCDIIAATAGPGVRVVAGGAGFRRIDHRAAVAATGGLPRVTVVIPTKDNPDLLARACRSVRTAAGVTAEIVIVDNGAVSEAQKALLAELAIWDEVRIVDAAGPFNFSSLINAGRAASLGDVLVLLNDDIESLDEVWLQELAAQAARPGIGCVGALLLYPDRRIQHAGVLLGINGGAGHAFRFTPEAAVADNSRLGSVREVAAVTAACLAVQTAVFDAVGGFSEDLPVTLNDVDFCLKVRAGGWRNLYTPHARLLHRESTSRGLDATPEKLRRLSRETAVFRAKWSAGAIVDPYLSLHASRAHEDYRARLL